MNEPIGFTRIVEFSPAFDMRSTAPAENYGIGSVKLRMILLGPLGATQFVLLTGWYLPEVQRELLTGHSGLYPADLGYHSPRPLYDDQPIFDCDLLPGGKCYYDGSGLRAEGVFERLLREGHKGVWKALEEEYHLRFEETA